MANIEVTKEGIYIIIRDPVMIYRHKISPIEALELSKKLRKALFTLQELTGENPLKKVGNIE